MGCISKIITVKGDDTVTIEYIHQEKRSENEARQTVMEILS